MRKTILIIKEVAILYCVIFTLTTIINSVGWLWFGVATNPDVHGHIMLRAAIVAAIAIGIVIIKKIAFMGSMKHYIITCSAALVIILVAIWLLSSGEGSHPDAFRDLTRSIAVPYVLIAATIGVVRYIWNKKSNRRKVMPKHIVREITPADYPNLDDFLYHAIFIPEGEKYPDREIIFQPEIYVYVKDFGGKDDCGVIAEIDGQLVGAAWARIIPAYGNIDDKTPELAISMLPEYRGQGIGTDLMNALFEQLRKRGYARTSLSVQQNNPAVRFYERLGYVVTDEKKDHAGHDDFIMVKNLQAEKYDEGWHNEQ